MNRVSEIVSGMVRAGSAQVVLGNHEFNALAYHTPDGKGGCHDLTGRCGPGIGSPAKS